MSIDHSSCINKNMQKPSIAGTPWDSMATPRHRRKVRHRELRTQRGDDIWAQNDIVDKKSVGKLRGNQLLFKKKSDQSQGHGKEIKSNSGDVQISWAVHFWSHLRASADLWPLDQAETPKLLASNPPNITCFILKTHILWSQICVNPPQ